MELKCLVIFLLIGTALTENNPLECTENRVEECIDTLLEKVLSTDDESEMCQFLKEASQCLRDTAQDCLGDNRDEDVDKALDEMDAQISVKCSGEESREFISSIDSQAPLTMSTALAEEDSDPCSVNRVNACIEPIWTKDDEICPVLKEASQCLRNTAQECFGGLTDGELVEALDEMELLIRQQCGKENETKELLDEDQECVEENEDYILSCIPEITTAVTEMELPDSDILKCTFYSLVAECVVDRIVEKCGEDAGEVAQKNMDDKPEEIVEACENSDPIDLFSVSLLDTREKRK